MKASELVTYLQAVIEEAGDIPVVVQPLKAHAHALECPEVIDKARFWDDKELKRHKAVVIR